MTTPRLLSEAQRIGIIGATADVHPDDYRYPREQKRYSPALEPTAPVVSWGREALIAIGYLVFIAWAIWAAGPLAAIVKGWH